MANKNLDDIFNLRARFATEEEQRAFESAARNNDTRAIEKFIDSWPDAARDWRSSDGKPIILATYNYLKPETLQLLISKGADINQPDDDGSWPPAHHCAFLQNADKLEMLIRHGADIEKKDKYGRTAVMMALEGKKHDCLDLLVLCSADLDAIDTFGKTPRGELEKNPKAAQVVFAAQQRLKEFLSENPVAQAPAKPDTPAAADEYYGIPTMKIIVLKNARGNKGTEGKGTEDKTPKPEDAQAEKPAPQADKTAPKKSLWGKFGF